MDTPDVIGWTIAGLVLLWVPSGIATRLDHGDRRFQVEGRDESRKGGPMPAPVDPSPVGKREATLVVKRFIGDDGMSSGLRHFSTTTLYEFLEEVGRVDEKLLHSIRQGDGYISKATLLKRTLIQADPPTQLRILKGLLEEVEHPIYKRGLDALCQSEERVQGLVQQLEERPVAPRGSPVPSDDVWRIIETAETLIRAHGPEETIDRLHTALHAHVREVCDQAGIELDEEASLTRAFKLLRQQHPAFDTRPANIAAPERVMQQLAGVLHELNEARNNKSRAHPNTTLPPEDARIFVDGATIVFNYVNAKIEAENRGNH